MSCPKQNFIAICYTYWFILLDKYSLKVVTFRTCACFLKYVCTFALHVAIYVMLGFAVFWDDLKLGLGDDKKKFLVVKIKKPHDMRVQGKYHF